MISKFRAVLISGRVKNAIRKSRNRGNENYFYVCDYKNFAKEKAPRLPIHFLPAAIVDRPGTARLPSRHIKL
jgi:hypothetical protein